MKIKITNKELRKNFSRVYNMNSIGVDNILRLFTPFAYTCGVYGWNADYYNIEGIIVGSGYRSVVGETIKDTKLIKKFEALDKRVNELLKNKWADVNFNKKKQRAMKRFAELLHITNKEGV